MQDTLHRFRIFFATPITVVLFLIAYSQLALAQSPITLTSATVPFNEETLTTYVLDTTKLVIPTKGANQTWSYGSVAVKSSLNEQLFRGDSDFPPAFIYDTLGLEPLVSSNGKSFGITFYEEFEQTANGITQARITLPAQGYNIDSASGDTTNDSLWVAAQEDPYSTPQIYFSLPATMNSTWSTTNAIRSIDMKIRISKLSLFYPGITDFKKTSSFTTTDTVVGWGNLTIPSSSGPSTVVPALMVKVNQARVDSFYLAGFAAAPIVLSGFGLAQGVVTHGYSYRFYSQSSLLPLLRIEYSDSNYSIPMSAISSQSELADVSATAAPEAIQMYPNPATNSMTVTSSAGAFRVLDPLGRTYNVRQEGNTLDVSSLSPGVYFLSNGGHNEKFVKQ